MRKVEVLFVTPNHTGLMRMVGQLVEGVCGSKFSHVAMYMFNGIFESIMPEVTVAEITKYDNLNCKEVLSIEDEDY